MLKWYKLSAGDYSTKCGRFNLYRCQNNETLGIRHVWWNLYCTNSNVTMSSQICDGWGIVDGFNTKREAQKTAQDFVNRGWV